ncbi:MAG TPA: MFS transporter [Pseudolabrys sp.]|nr:MFS transporter [Pseudolabrys sp.]
MAITRESSKQPYSFFVLLWLCGICLRVPVLAIPPVLPLLHASLHLSEADVGWLSSLPPMLLAFAAVPGSLIIARLGLVPALLIGLLLDAVGAASRGLSGSLWFLCIATVVMSAGVAIVQTVMPPLVRDRLPERIGSGTAIYTNGLLIGELLAVALTVPIVLPMVHDSWRLGLVVWSVPVFVTAMLVSIWLVPKRAALVRPLGADSVLADPAPKRTEQRSIAAWWPNWRNPLIWRLGLMVGCVNAMYFVINAFLPDYVIASGRPDLVSSALTALNLAQLPAAFLMLPLAQRLFSRPSAYMTTGFLSFASIVAMLLMRGQWIVFWSGVFGFTDAVTLIMAFALPSALSVPADVPRTTAGMFTISYSFAMTLSWIVGWLWDLTKAPIVGFVLIALCGLVIMAMSSIARHANQPSAVPAAD